MSGWVKLHRKAVDHPALSRFDEMGVWSMLLMRAAREPAAVRFRGKMVALQRGQLAISIREQAAKGGLEYKRMRIIVDRFRDQGMITVSAERGAHFCIITVCNFEKFQESEAQSGAHSGRTQGALRAHSGRTEQEGENLDSNHVEPESLPSPAAPAPLPDPCATLWALGRAILPGPNPGGLMGRWCGRYGEPAVFKAMTEFRSVNDVRQRAEPVGWITDNLKRQARNAGRSALATGSMLDDVARELAEEEAAGGQLH